MARSEHGPATARCSFCDDDWPLQVTSSMIDAGNPAAAYNDADGSSNDIGAYGGPGSVW